MAATSTFTYNNGIYVPWTSPASTTAPAMTTAAATVASATPRWSPATTEEVDYTITQAFVQQSTTAATTTAWQAQTTSAAAAAQTTQSAYTPVISAETASPSPSTESVAEVTITPSPSSTSKGQTGRSIMVVGTPTATATIGSASKDSSSTTTENGFKKVYLIPLVLLVPCIIIAALVLLIRRCRRQRRHGLGDPYDEEGGLVVGGKSVGDDEYSDKTSIATVQRRSSKWSFVRQSMGRRERRNDEMSDISEAPSLPFRAVSYSSVQGGRNSAPEDRPFQPPVEERVVNFNRFFNTLPRVEERDFESGNVHNGRWEAPSGFGAVAGNALDAGKRMLGGWGWSSKQRRLELISPRPNGSTNTRGSMRIPSPSIYSPNPEQNGPYAGLQGIDEDDHVDLDAYLGESRVGDSLLASRYLDDPQSVPVREDYRLPHSLQGPKPMPRPGMVVVDLPAAPSKSFLSPTKKSAILPAADPGTPPPNAGLLFKYDSPASTPVRHSIPTPSSPRPPLPTPPATSIRPFALPAYQSEAPKSHSNAFNLGAVYDPPVVQQFKPLAPATRRPVAPGSNALAGSPRQLKNKPSRDLFVQSMPEPEPMIIPSGTLGVRKKKPLPEMASSSIIDFGDSPTLEPLHHPSKVKNAIHDFENRTKVTTSPTKVDLMGHDSPARAQAPLTQSNVGKLLLARRTDMPLAESAIADDDDDASVYSVDDSVIADRPVYNSNARVMPTLAGARYTRPVVDSKPLSSDPKRLSAMLRRPSLPQLKDEEA
ncbi:BQ2448_1032 [Microbotryum intermedium]|uniref:BQ2448_1032 protein n=1 Tax=Microbotryum intermedium TaxID=269621 RepID=A0A238F9W1_9BASI|nr:BQ2448_1032 [Microbotryum intermedium]